MNSDVFAPTDAVIEAIASVSVNLEHLEERIILLNHAEFEAGSSGKGMMAARLDSVRARLLLKYFAIDQEYNLVRSYATARGGLRCHGPLVR